MDSFLEFAKGPLFRFTFGIMCLGLIRIFVLSLINGFEAKGKAAEKKLPIGFVRKMTIGFTLPIRAYRVKPIYATISIIFHIGMIITPLFLYDHLLLFYNAIGFAWLGLTIPKSIADILTIVTIVSGITLVIMRFSRETSRYISRTQDFIWPILIVIPFATGYFCSNTSLSPSAYNAFLLVHILIAEIIFLLIPFTKIAHCVLIPISQWVTARSWKFVPGAGERVRITLGKEGEPV